MRAHSLQSPEIAALTGYASQTVRAWLCGVRTIPSAAWEKILAQYPADS